MKKIIPILLLVLVFNCSKKTDDAISNIALPFDINYYAPNTFLNQTKVPQLSLKNDIFQITAIGSYSFDDQELISKVYLSNTSTETEWIVLVNDAGSPEFMYGLSTTSKERLSYLYEIEEINTASYILRYYDYDWENRLGTLLYEAKVSGEEIEIIFNNELTSNKSLNKKSNQSFSTPVLKLEKYFLNTKKNKIKNAHHKAKSSSELDEFFDFKLNELTNLLKETKSKLINTNCQVSEILNKSDKNFICQISDGLDNIINEKIFDDLEELTNEELTDEVEGFSGASFDIDLNFFDNLNIDLSDLSDHFNSIKNNLNTDIIDFINDLNTISDIDEEDLNDLPDSNGVIQIGLSWNTDADIDLHVVDPFGDEIFYSNPSSGSGGYLDRDDTDGYGPENIYWASDIPAGKYSVSLVYYGPVSGGPSTDCVVKIINGLGVSKTFNVSLGYFNGNKIEVTDFIFEDVTNNIVFP